MDEIMQLAIYLREGFDAALTYVVDPDDRPPWDELIEDAPPWVELIEDEINDRINKAHRAAARLAQIERERAGQMRVDSE